MNRLPAAPTVTISHPASEFRPTAIRAPNASAAKQTKRTTVSSMWPPKETAPPSFFIPRNREQSSRGKKTVWKFQLRKLGGSFMKSPVVILKSESQSGLRGRGVLGFRLSRLRHGIPEGAGVDVERELRSAYLKVGGRQVRAHALTVGQGGVDASLVRLQIGLDRRSGADAKTTVESGIRWLQVIAGSATHAEWTRHEAASAHHALGRIGQVRHPMRPFCVVAIQAPFPHVSEHVGETEGIPAAIAKTVHGGHPRIPVGPIEPFR